MFMTCACLIKVIMYVVSIDLKKHFYNIALICDHQRSLDVKLRILE